MVYFCADDYGISPEGNKHIEECLKNGVLNKVSVMPNGNMDDFKEILEKNGATISLHLNLIEGYPLSPPDEVKMLLNKDGSFRYSFSGLFLLSLFGKRKEFEKQLFKEIQSQIKFWKKAMGENAPLCIDSHQHTHMIPLIFKTLLRVIKDENMNLKSIRIPAEPILPYVFVPSLYLCYTPVNILKQWVLNVLATINAKRIKVLKIKPAYFIGIMFSGRMCGDWIKKILPRYMKLSEKNGRDIEMCFHPGYMEKGEKILEGTQKGFHKFYFSPWRKREYDTLINF